MKRIFLMLLLASSSLLAQANEQHFYKLDFVVKEVEGNQVISAKTHSTLAEANGGKCMVRAGAKIPVPSAPGSAQYTFYDIGTSIDCNSIHEIPSGLALSVTADISSLFRDPAVPNAYPVIRQNRWSSEVTIPLKKAAVLFTADDPGSKRQLQLELTATPLK